MISAKQPTALDRQLACGSCAARPEPDAAVVARVLVVGPAWDTQRIRLCRSCCHQLAEAASRILEEPATGRGPDVTPHETLIELIRVNVTLLRMQLAKPELKARAELIEDLATEGLTQESVARCRLLLPGGVMERMRAKGADV